MCCSPRFCKSKADRTFLHTHKLNFYQREYFTEKHESSKGLVSTYVFACLLACLLAYLLNSKVASLQHFLIILHSQAYRKWVREHWEEPRLPGMMLTNEQVFFISFARVSRKNKTGCYEKSTLLSTQTKYLGGRIASSYYTVVR